MGCWVCLMCSTYMLLSECAEAIKQQPESVFLETCKYVTKVTAAAIATATMDGKRRISGDILDLIT